MKKYNRHAILVFALLFVVIYFSSPQVDFASSKKTPTRVSVKYSSVTTTSAKIKWTKSKGSKGYYVYQLKKNSKGKNYYKKIKTTKNLYFTVKKLKPNTKYAFLVKPYNKYKCGKISKIKYVKTKKKKSPPVKVYDIKFNIAGQHFYHNIDQGKYDFGKYATQEFSDSSKVRGFPSESLTYQLIYNENDCITIDSKGLIIFNRPGTASIKVITSTTRTSEICSFTVYSAKWMTSLNTFGNPTLKVKLSEKQVDLNKYIQILPSNCRNDVLKGLKFSIITNNCDCITLKPSGILQLNNGSLASIKAESNMTTLDKNLNIIISSDCVLPVDEQYIKEHHSSDAYVIYQGKKGNQAITIRRGAKWLDVLEKIGNPDSVYPRPDCNLYVYDINYGYEDGKIKITDGDFDHFLGVYVYKETQTIAGWITNQRQLAVINGKEIIKNETPLSEIRPLFADVCFGNIDNASPYREGNKPYLKTGISTDEAYDRASLSLMFAGSSLNHVANLSDTISFAEIVPQSFQEWDSGALGGKATDLSDRIYMENQINMCRKAYEKKSAAPLSLLTHDTSLEDEDTSSGTLLQMMVGFYDICDVAYNYVYLSDLCINTDESEKFTVPNRILVTDHIKIGREKK